MSAAAQPDRAFVDLKSVYAIISSSGGDGRVWAIHPTGFVSLLKGDGGQISTNRIPCVLPRLQPELSLQNEDVTMQWP